ncbi:DNA polymerase III subunit chi [Telmatospirillum sp.]|uniref:DNA polymerase III subunit chi n=1 Tax=Telmatospirillum sp. TaxID=2079197 RepID=UPI002840D17D|nr:DNA polymerase III subunit chi [Telmatospirillum sp.]MDR3440630.1 DNA polymerase III subunit chi [Telmatospirillum sp.]
MTPRVGFYHLQKTSLEQALPRLLEKVLESRQRALVMAGSAERVAFLDSMLWTADPSSWIPHGTTRDGDADCQPIYLTDRDENPNNAKVLLLTDGVVCDRVGDFSRCLNLFDGKDEVALNAARALWKEWKGLGYDLTYYQQTDRGGWLEKARANAPNVAEVGVAAGANSINHDAAGGEVC